MHLNTGPREKRLLNNKQKTDTKQRTSTKINTKNLHLGIYSNKKIKEKMLNKPEVGGGGAQLLEEQGWELHEMSLQKLHNKRRIKWDV